MTEEQQPLLRIVRGNPSDEELAALTAVISALATTPAATPAKPRSTWTNRARLARPTLRPGPGAWRASGLPR